MPTRMCGAIWRRFSNGWCPTVIHFSFTRLKADDDMPAHIRTALTGVNLSIPVLSGRLALGAWQGIYVWEHRLQGHARCVVLHLLGE
jgi:secondary thiamine-phosphate synthase enzyme